VKVLRCQGWTTPKHATLLLSDDGKPDDKISDTICPACQRAINDELDAKEAKR
jgi:hypothetical protein